MNIIQNSSQHLTARRQKPAIGEIYHVYNRGVEKRNIFKEKVDYFRFVHDLFEFNDIAPAGKWSSKQSEVGAPKVEPRKLLVEILAFCLMPNHFHLMLRQKEEAGIPEFMRKLGAGYTYFFNNKYERSGCLFQGKYKLVHIIDDNHLQHLPHYIHLNPLDIIMPEWREGSLQNEEKAFQFLESYRWSSLLDYMGKKNFPSVTQREYLREMIGNPHEQKRTLQEWIERNRFEEIEHLALE